jgi:hypothetical protein
LQFFPGDSLARTLQQHDQDVDRLPLQPDLKLALWCEPRANRWPW